MASDIEVYSGHDFGEKMSFTVGISYMTGMMRLYYKHQCLGFGKVHLKEDLRILACQKSYY